MATQEKTWNVANRLHSLKDSDNPEVNHIIAGADEIYDDAKGAKQSDINAQTDAAIADRYTKAQVDAAIADIDVTGQLADYAKKTEVATALAAKQDVLTFDNTPTDGSTNPVTSGGVKAAIDAVDVSEQLADYALKTEVTSAVANETTRAQGVEATKANTVDVNAALGNKQDTIQDLTTIRSGAALGATAQQPATTLAGYGITDGYTKTEGQALETQVTNAIDSVQDAVNQLNGNEVVVVDDHTTVTNPDGQKIYREQGSNSYTDWMYQDSSWKRIAIYNMPGFDNAPIKNSEKIVKSSGVFKAIQDDAVFDVSAHNLDLNQNPTPYESLALALAAIPTDYKKGGMSIKFIKQDVTVSYRVVNGTSQGASLNAVTVNNQFTLADGSYGANDILTAIEGATDKAAVENAINSLSNNGDIKVIQYDLNGTNYAIWTITKNVNTKNEYVQYRFLGATTDGFTTVANWQGVDDKPMIGSKNLVESKGVFESFYNTSIGTIKTPSSTGTGYPQITNRTINTNTNYTYAIYSIIGEDYIGIVPQNIAGIVAAGMGILFTNDLSDLSGARWRNYKELNENNVIDTGGYSYVIIAKSYIPNGTSYGDAYDANVDTKYQQRLTNNFIIPSTIVLQEWVNGTSYKVGNQVQDSSGDAVKYYACRKATNSQPLSNTSYWKELIFDIGGTSIQTVNIGDVDKAIYQQCIKLVGFGTNASSAGATKVGEIYYNTTFHYLSKVTRLSPSEQNIQIPYYDGAIYNYNDALYVWNGSELVNKTPEYIIDKKPIIASNNFVRSGGVASELYNTVRGDIKTPYTTGTGYIQVTTHNVVQNANYNYAVYDIDGEDIISIVGYYIEQNPSLGIVFTNDSSLSNLTDARWVAYDELDANGGIAVGDYHYVAITKTYIPTSANFGDIYESSIQSKFMPFAKNISFVEGGIKSNGYLNEDGNDVLSIYALNNKQKHLINSNTNCPIVIFSYDDNTTEDDTLVEMLDARGLKGTFACQGFNVDVYPELADTLGKKLYRWSLNGHGTLGHGITGGTSGLPGAGGLNNMCDADCYKQIAANNKFFDTFGLSHKGIVYFNTWEHNPHTISIVGQYYDYGIISGSGMITPDVDLYKLTRYVTDNANMLTNAKKLVDSAIGKNCIISFGGHMNRTGKGGSYSSMADFTELLDYIAEKVSNHQMISLNVDDAVQLFSARNAALGGLKADKQYNPSVGQMCLTANGLEICTGTGAYAIFDIAISGTISAGVIQLSNIPTYDNATYVEVTLTDESTIADIIETFKKQIYKDYTLVAKDDSTMRLYANSAEYRSTPAVVTNETSLEFTITRVKGGEAPTWLQLGGN